MEFAAVRQKTPDEHLQPVTPTNTCTYIQANMRAYTYHMYLHETNMHTPHTETKYEHVLRLGKERILGVFRFPGMTPVFRGRESLILLLWSLYSPTNP